MRESKRARGDSFEVAAGKDLGLFGLSDDPIEISEDDAVHECESCISPVLANAKNDATSRFPKRKHSMNPFVYTPYPGSSGTDVDDIPPTEPFTDEDGKT